MTTTMNYGPGAKTDLIESQDTTTSSISMEVMGAKFKEDFYLLRNNAAFDFWNFPEENIY